MSNSIDMSPSDNTSKTTNIDEKYSEFYRQRHTGRVYPTEFVVRSFLASYPQLCLKDHLSPGSSILDIGFGDTRNSLFLAEQEYKVSGVEITDTIVNQGVQRMQDAGYTVNFKVGRNSNIPFEDCTFDCVLACHSCYYVDEDDTFSDNLQEIQRVLKPSGWFVGSLPDQGSYIFSNGEKLTDGSIRIMSDPYKVREGYKLRAFNNRTEIEDTLAIYFHEFAFGKADNNYYGIDERVFWVACQKK